MNVKFNGGVEVAGTVKIRGFDTFSICKSREGGYRVSYGRTLKLSCRRRLYSVYICYVKKVRRLSSLTNREIKYKIFKFWIYYETAKFTRDQPD